MKLEPGVLPKRPYRDSALLYGGFAIVVVVIVGVTGGALLPRLEDGNHVVVGAVPLAAVCFLLATGYSWWRIRERLAAEDEES